MPDTMDDSILETIKQALGIPLTPGAFDFEITMHINSALATLSQIGIPAEGGFSITGTDEKWSDLLETNKKLNNVKSYVFMKVKMIFDSANMPSHLVTAYNERIKEEEWRIQVEADPMLPQYRLAEGQAFLWELDENDNFPLEAAEGDVGISMIDGRIWRKSDE